MRLNPLSLAFLIAFPVAAQTKPGNAITVHVVNRATRTPVAGANVVLDSQDDHLGGRTDAGGIFAGQTHSSGRHLLIVTRRGFQTAGEGMGKMVDLKPGSETNLTVELLPLGVITGRVLDQYGDPLHGAIVRTEDKVSVPGQEYFYQSDSAATTDDRGEYRISEVVPGKHTFAVEYNTEQDSTSGTCLYRWPQTGGLVLYPDVTDIEQAQQTEVGPGETIRLKDVHIKIERAVTISGRVKPPPSADIMLRLEPTLKLALHSSRTSHVIGPEPNGSFKMDVLPGAYVLKAEDMTTHAVSKPLAVEVRDAPITNLELELTAAADYEINGRFAVDGPEYVDFPKLLLNFGGPTVKIDASGTFRENLPGPEVMYMLQGLPEEWYIKEALLAGKQATTGHLKLDEPGSSDLVITLSSRGARIEITLEGTVSPMDAMFVALVPETGVIADPEAPLNAMLDPSGKFIVHAVPPGSYRVFTLDASNWPLLMRPELLLEKYRKLGTLVNVAEGERKSIVVPLSRIPAE